MRRHDLMFLAGCLLLCAAWAGLTIVLSDSTAP
jgi:hypothetical protein